MCPGSYNLHGEDAEVCMFTENNKNRVKALVCVHVWPVNLVLIQHNAELNTADEASIMNVAAKKPQILKQTLDASQTSSTRRHRRSIPSGQFQCEQPGLAPPVWLNEKHGSNLFFSELWYNNSYKSAFREHVDVTLTLNFVLLDVKCI